MTTWTTEFGWRWMSIVEMKLRDRYWQELSVLANVNFFLKGIDTCSVSFGREQHGRVSVLESSHQWHGAAW